MNQTDFYLSKSEASTSVDTSIDHPEGSGHDSGLNNADKIILFLMLTLFMGLVCKEFSKKFGIPYTPLLIITGAMFGATKFWGRLSESTENSKLIDPHDILQILLPILIFESSYNAHIEVLTKNIMQVIILVIPGVLICIFFLGFLVKYALNYEEMSFSAACILGSILASTDPVAVVALLKELGAPLHIETLIEMESLFNDGTSMVFFIIFSEIATGSEVSFGSAIAMFFQLAIGGLLLGVALGLCALICTHIFTRGKTLFISLLVILSYMTFFIAEKFDLGLSGLLGLVAAGLVVNLTMKDYMTTEQKESVQAILSYLQYTSETVLFFLSGIFMGQILFRQSDLVSDQEQSIISGDWGKLVALYFFLILSRAVTVVVLYPLLKKTGEGISAKEAIVAIWGGLRGALGLALALIVFNDNNNYKDPLSERVKILILFHTCGVACLTLLVNGTTCGFLLKQINLITNSPIKINFKKFYLRKLQEQAHKNLNEMKQSDYFDLAVWESVEQLIDQKQFDTVFKDLQIQEQNIYLNKEKKSLNLEGVNLERIRYDQIRNFMNFLTLGKCQEWITGKNYNLVFDAAEEATEALEKKLNMWHYIHFEMMSIKGLQLFKRLSQFPLIGKFFDIWLHYELNNQHELIYIFCTTLAQTMLSSRQFLDDLQSTKHGLNYQALIPRIIEEMKEQFDIGRSHLSELKKDFPEILCKLEQRKAAMRIIMAQNLQIDEDVANHYIPEADGISLKNMLSEKLQHISSFKTLYKLTTIKFEIMANTFKNVLLDHELNHLRENSQLINFQKGETILKKGNQAFYVYVLNSGEAGEIISREDQEDEMQDKEYIFKLTHGQILGIVNLIDEKIESHFDVVALTDCEVRQLDIKDLRYLFNENDKFENWCYKKSLYMFIQIFHHKEKLARLSREEMNHFANNSDLMHLDSYEQNEKIFTYPYGGFIFYGKIFDIQKQKIIERFQLIPESNSTYQIMEESLILVFKPSQQHLKQQRFRKLVGQQQRQKISFNPQGFNPDLVPINSNQYLIQINDKAANIEQTIQQIQGNNGIYLQSLNQPIGDPDKLEDKRIESSLQYDREYPSARESIDGSFYGSINQSYQMAPYEQDSKQINAQRNLSQIYQRKQQAVLQKNQELQEKKKQENNNKDKNLSISGQKKENSHQDQQIE